MTPNQLTPQLKIGDRVMHIGSEANKRYRENMGVGEVISILNNRIRVKWECARRARNHKAHNLELLASKTEAPR